MYQNNLLNIWSNKSACINGWLSLPNSFTAEAFGKMGWDSITIDMQHGLNDYQTCISMLQALNSSKSVPFVRIPWVEPGIIMKSLDLGFMGIIAPMINSKKDCEKFVSYCQYPPLGKRSFGPIRAQLIHGLDYYENANNNIVCFAMIETQEAINNIDEILSVPGLTGVYIGPADMSSAFGLKPKFDVAEEPIYSNIKMIVKKATECNKVAGIHNGTTQYAKQMIEMGFKFVTISSDFRSMLTHAQSIIDEMKQSKNKLKKSDSY